MTRMIGKMTNDENPRSRHLEMAFLLLDQRFSVS
jgi:hypothetical protein